MAKIKLGAILQDIKGQLGDQAIYGAWKSNIHWIRQAATAVHNPNSWKQSWIRELWSRYSKRWQTLTSAQQAGWNAYAINGFGGGAKMGEGSSLDIIKLNTGKYSGLNAYILTNLKAEVCAITPIDNAPIGATPPSQPQELSGLIAGWGATWQAPTILDVPCYIIIWIAPRTGNLFHPQFVMVAGAIDLSVPFASIYGPDGADIITEIPSGFKYKIQAYCINGNGTFSAPSNIGFGTAP